MLKLVQPVIRGEQVADSLWSALEAFCEAIVTGLGYEATWIWLNDKTTWEVKQASNKRFDEEFPSPTSVEHGAAALYNGTSGTGMGIREPVRRNVSVSGLSTWCDEDLDAGNRSAISFPLKVRDVVVGTLCVYSDKKDAFSPEEARILEIFSETAALAIEKADVDVAGLNLIITRKNVKPVLRKSVSPGEVYLFRGNLKELLQLFRNHLDDGWNGLFVSGRATDEIWRAAELRTVPTFQITGDASLVNAVWSYSGLMMIVASVMHVRDRPLILIDKLEELERSPQRGHLHVFLEDLRRQVTEVNGAAIIHMDSIENTWRDILEKYCTSL